MEGKLNKDEEISALEFIAKQWFILREVLREFSARNDELEKLSLGLQELVDTFSITPSQLRRVVEMIDKTKFKVQELRESCFSLESSLTKLEIAKLNVTERERIASDIAALSMGYKEVKEAISLMEATLRKND